MYVMLTQKLSKGFKSWKDMVHENGHKLEGFKGKHYYFLELSKTFKTFWIVCNTIWHY